MAPEEVDPKALIRFLWKRKVAVLAGTLLAAALGAGYAFLQPNVYQSVSVLYPKGGSPDAAQQRLLGGLGGLVGTLAPNESADKIRQVTQSRSLLQEMVESGDLMGELFPERWDARERKWIVDSSKIPTVNRAVGKLKGMIQVRFEKPGNAFRVETKAPDPKLAQRVNQLFVETLNKRLSRVALQEAKKNQDYLSQKLGDYTDPYLRSKLENLVAAEIERAMLIHSEAVEVIDPPVVPERKAGPRRGFLTISFALTGFLFTCIGLLARAMLRE